MGLGFIGYSNFATNMGDCMDKAFQVRESDCGEHPVILFFAGHFNKTPSEVDVADGTPPGFHAAVARPAALRFRVTGMGFLSDGRMALANWGGFGRQGSLYLMEGMGGNPDAIKATVIAKDIWEPMGIKVLDDAIYYTAQDGIFKVSKAAGEAEKWETRLVSAFIIPLKTLGMDFPIAFNTAYQGGSFYYSTGAYKNFNAPPMNEEFLIGDNAFGGVLDGGDFASIVSVASQREGFDLRFTEPLADNAINPDWFWVTSYRYEPTSAYGGPKMDSKRMKITAIRSETDRKTLALSVEGLEAGRVYRIMLSPEVKTAAGKSLWTRNAWYTLNRIAEVSPLGTTVANADRGRTDADRRGGGRDPLSDLGHRGGYGVLAGRSLRRAAKIVRATGSGEFHFHIASRIHAAVILAAATL